MASSVAVGRSAGRSVGRSVAKCDAACWLHLGFANGCSLASWMLDPTDQRHQQLSLSVSLSIWSQLLQATEVKEKSAYFEFTRKKNSKFAKNSLSSREKVLVTFVAGEDRAIFKQNLGFRKRNLCLSASPSSSSPRFTFQRFIERRCLTRIG